MADETKPDTVLSTRNVDYTFENKLFSGYLCTPDNKRKLPGVFIVHTWLGLDNSIKARAERIASLGYAAFVVDLFGPGVLPKPPHESLDAIKPFIEDRKHFRKALSAGLESFKSMPDCSDKIAAIGYCFGGCAVLEMARDGQPVTGVVSLHGELNTTLPAKANEVAAKVLVMHGDADIVVKPETIPAFLEEMRNAGADWEFIVYSGAKHSFTGEGAMGKSTPEAGLNEHAERRSWNRMAEFLSEVL